MIDATTARLRMPSVQKINLQRQERLEEISKMITEAARNDMGQLILEIYDYEEYYIIHELEEKGYFVVKTKNTMQFNGDTYKVKYLISWR